MPREEQRGLARRVARADDVDVQSVRARRVAPRGAVRDALARELLPAVDREPPPDDAAREDDRARAEDVSAVEVDVARLGVDPHDLARHEDLRTEPARLAQRAARELVAGHAFVEPEVVLDP